LNVVEVIEKLCYATKLLAVESTKIWYLIPFYSKLPLPTNLNIETQLAMINSTIEEIMSTTPLLEVL